MREIIVRSVRPDERASVKWAAKPTWQNLTREQQVSLGPLEAIWSSLSEAQRRKWLLLAAGYAQRPSLEQATLHSRMTEWAGLSQSQRAKFHLNSASLERGFYE